MNTAPLCPVTPARLDQLMAVIFFAGRSARSPEYRAGCRAAVSKRLGGPATPNLYAAGTASADAWWAGWDEGMAQASDFTSQAQADGWGSAGQCPASDSAKTPAVREQVRHVVATGGMPVSTSACAIECAAVGGGIGR
ncbi:hypothetical protein [Xanthomonas cucurbitae]|uniref:Uncharacterized protein n=1 Tax=Xanthomonas cucurbitae TaxID=56453 RepID=A0ABY7YAB1_9XANT|nr:hypothetical protein [Xanthomonas cucurbitae]WDM66894.1 hypothetical protein K6981_15495 [Xanthomonas cucurbitae]WDM70771.1 hypothetical protein K6978_15465 [Xanthomonas cucurbitae]